MKHILGFMLALTLILTFFSSVRAEVEEVYFKFECQSRDELSRLTKIISIDNVKNGTVFAYANSGQFEQFKALGYDYIILPRPSSLVVAEMSSVIADIQAWDVYPTYDGYVSMMNQFAIDHPSLCTVQNIGNSVQGRQLLVAKLSANVNVEEDEPEVFYTSTMHGNETTGYVLMLRLIDSLLTGYGVDPEVTYILDNMEVYINPLANPDGTYHGGNNTVNGATRYNANGSDLNRNFPDPQDGQHPDGMPWQPETIAMMNFADAHNIVISANFHGGAEVVNYPWDTWSTRHADDAWFIQISRQYADTAQYYSPPGYMTDLNDGITNGWDWYEVDGGRQDYMTYFQGGREVTIEISSTQLLPAGQLPAYWGYNRQSFLQWIQQSLFGIRGIVTDAVSGLPVDAKIIVLNHDADNSQVFTDPDIGNYHRMIQGGTFNIQFSAEGYSPVTVNDVLVRNRDITIVNVQLQPFSGQLETIYADDFSTNQGWTGIGGTAEWTIGVATGGQGSDSYGGPDPSVDHSPSSDNRVLGNDLTSGTGGDYNASITSTQWITSPPIDCSGHFGVSLTFYRWLGVESGTYDHAYLQAYNGTSWVALFENGSSTIDESAWGAVNYDVSTVADGNVNFKLRFGLGGTDGSWQYCGWNIDDIEVKGYANSQTPIVSIDMIPNNPPISVPRGGSFTFTGILTNNTNQSQITDVWIMLNVPGYGMYGPLVQFNNLTLAPNQTLTASNVSQFIPGNAPIGTYSYISYCGDNPTVKIDSASFPFTVTAAVGGDAQNWDLSGWFEQGIAELPQTTALYSNYPNPFNANTTIEYTLAENTQVRLEIFNLLGQKVTTIVDEHQAAGYKLINWDASQYSSGVYFYKLSASDEVFTKRMTLLK